MTPPASWLAAADLAALGRDAGLLLLAWLLGGLIGWQREATGRAAGLRTHVLVCVAACLITRVSFETRDPGRIAAQIVTGVGFLGAGVILRRGVSVRGLTTAATIWTVAGIGIAVGAGGPFALLAALTTVIVLATLTLAKRLEAAIRSDSRVAVLSATVPRFVGAAGQLVETLTEAGADVIGYEIEDSEDGGGNAGPRTILVTLRLRQDVSRNDLTGLLLERVPRATFEWDRTDEG
jgi:putative Mg2+ transporter-C (MgtC) family protein